MTALAVIRASSRKNPGRTNNRNERAAVSTGGITAQMWASLNRVEASKLGPLEKKALYVIGRK